MQTIHTILVVHSINFLVCGQHLFNGTATSANAMVVGPNNRTASTSATNDTVAVRDSPGNLAANLFRTATEALMLTWLRNTQQMTHPNRYNYDDWRR